MKNETIDIEREPFHDGRAGVEFCRTYHGLWETLTPQKKSRRGLDTVYKPALNEEEKKTLTLDSLQQAYRQAYGYAHHDKDASVSTLTNQICDRLRIRKINIKVLVPDFNDTNSLIGAMEVTDLLPESRKALAKDISEHMKTLDKGSDDWKKLDKAFRKGGFDKEINAKATEFSTYTGRLDHVHQRVAVYQGDGSNPTTNQRPHVKRLGSLSPSPVVRDATDGEDHIRTIHPPSDNHHMMSGGLTTPSNRGSVRSAAPAPPTFPVSPASSRRASLVNARTEERTAFAYRG